MLRSLMLRMQTLGISESTPRSEGRLKALFWPSIENATDADYLGVQGYWVCAIAATLTALLLLLAGEWIYASLFFAFLFLSGVGVREHSFYAATAILIFFVMDTLITGVGVVRVIILGLLVSNLRATWLASRWKPDSEQAEEPPRMAESWGDKFSDQLPRWLWPKLRIFYRIYSGIVLMFTFVGLIGLIVAKHR